jgi:uncharacterized protein YhdP
MQIATTLQRFINYTIIALGLVVLIARLTLPSLSNLDADIVQLAKQHGNIDLKLSRAELTWRGTLPKVTLYDVQIDTESEPLFAKEISVNISPLALISSNPLAHIQVHVDQLALRFIRELDGKVHLAGFTQQSNDANTFLLPGKVTLHDVQLTWQDMRRAAAPITVDNLNAYIEGSDSHFYGYASLNSSIGELDFIADIDGNPLSSNWSGESQLHIKQLKLPVLAKELDLESIDITEGTGQLSLTQTWKDATIITNQGEVMLNHLGLSRNKKTLENVSLNALISTVRDNEATQVEVHANALKLANQQGAFKLALSLPHDAQLVPFKAGAKDLPIDIANQLLPFVASRPDSVNTLKQFSLQGKIKQAALSLFNDQLSITLDSENNALQAPSVFKRPFQLDALKTQVRVNNLSSNASVFIENVQIKSHGMLMNLNGAVTNLGNAPHMLISSDFTSIDIQHLEHFLPDAYLTTNLVTWLTDSLKRGTLDQGRLLINGPASHFPYDQTRDGSFSVIGRLTQAPLRFNPDWPAINDMSAELWFYENSMEVTADRGTILNSPLQTAHAEITSLEPISPLLINGSLNGPSQDALGILQSKALNKKLGYLADAFSLKGESRTELKLQIPLAKNDEKYVLNGAIHLNNTDLTLSSWPLTLQKVNGALALTLDGVSAKKLTGTLWDKPFTSHIKNKQGETRIHLNSALTIDRLKTKLPDLPLSGITGETALAAQFVIPPRDTKTPLELIIDSQLKGIDIDLPQPVGKPKAQAQPLRVSLPIDNGVKHVALSYKKNIHAIFSADGERGAITLGDKKPTLPNNKTLRLNINVPRVNLAQWQKALDQGESSNRAVELTIDTALMEFGATQFTNFKATLNSKDDALSAEIHSNQLVGSISRAKKNDTIVAKLKKAHLRFDPGVGKPASPKPEPSLLDPRSLPTLDLQIADFRLNDAPLGKLSMSSTRRIDGQEVEHLLIDGESGTADIHGYWVWGSPSPLTRIDGEINATDIGKLLKQLGYAEHTSESALDAKIKSLSWPGHPGQFHLASIEGLASMRYSKGRLNDLEPGITRVLGLLNLDAIGKRLRLDFGDVLKKGYSYDYISADFGVGLGQAATSNFHMQGATGVIDLGGRIGLVAEDFDLRVNVTPDLDTLLPLAASAVGGPVTGVATFLAQQVLGDRINRAYRFDYEVTGAWDDPQLSSLDTSGALSRFFNALTGKESKKATDQQKDMVKPTEDRKNIFQRTLKNLKGDDAK